MDICYYFDDFIANMADCKAVEFVTIGDYYDDTTGYKAYNLFYDALGKAVGVVEMEFGGQGEPIATCLM